MAWAKLHTDILGDPKLMRAARKGAKGLEYLPWLIAFAKQADDEGRLTVGGDPADAVDISDLIPGATARVVGSALSSLERIGVLERDGGALRFVRWHERSGGKPSDAPSAIGERVRRHRKAKSNAEQHGDSNAESNAGNETPSNALHDDDGDALHETPGNATEKRREEEKREEAEEKEPSPRPAAARKGRAGRPTWLSPYGDVWRAKFEGEMPWGPAADALAPLRKEWGDAEVLRRWTNYIAVATAEYVNPARFASTWARWNNALQATTNGRPSAADQMAASMQRIFSGPKAVAGGEL